MAEPTKPKLMPHEVREYEEEHGTELRETVSQEGHRISTQGKPPDSSGADVALSVARAGEHVFVEAYREIAAKKVPGDSQGRTYAQLIALRVMTSAARGNLKASIEAADRTGGKVLPAIPYVEPPPAEKEVEYNLNLLSKEELLTWEKLQIKAIDMEGADEALKTNVQAWKLEIEEQERCKASSDEYFRNRDANQEAKKLWYR